MTTKRYTTIHIVSFSKIFSGEDETPDEYCPVPNDMEKAYPGILSSLTRGDLVENSDESGYRSQGLWAWDGKKIIELNTNFDDYGSPPEEFKALDQFPPDYWTITISESNHNTISWSGEKQESYWHSTDTPVSIDDKTLKLIESAISRPEILVDIGDRKFIISKREYYTDLIEIPQFYHWSAMEYLTAFDKKWYKDIWNHAEQKFSNLRSISTIGDIAN
jgi:hypothetical protein